VRLLQTVAASMAVALQSAQRFDETQRLLKETEQRNAELAVINSIQQGIAGNLAGGTHHAFAGHGEGFCLLNDVAVAIGLTYSFLPFMILPVYSVFEKFDWRLVEAAHDLGATRSRALRRVILPVAMPGLLAGSLLVFIPCLGAFVTPALLGGGKTLMLGNVIQMQFGPSRNWPFGAAISVVLLAIMLVAMTSLALWRNRRSA
jgi:spermidine/putrescine transport system permease protein